MRGAYVQCSDCVFWQKLESIPRWGECRCHAPEPRLVRCDQNGKIARRDIDPHIAVWPLTEDSDGCHEGETPDERTWPPLPRNN